MVMFIGKTHYKWPCSIAMLNYQRVTCSNPSIVGIFHIFRPKYAQMVNANSPCHPLAFDKRMVRRMALLIRAGTNFISWTYFSPKNRWKTVGNFMHQKGHGNLKGWILCTKLMFQVDEKWGEFRNVDFFKAHPGWFFKSRDLVEPMLGWLCYGNAKIPEVGATEPVEHVGKSWSISQSHPVFFAQANPSESEHALPVSSYINLMGTYQWEVQNILGYYGINPLVI